MTVFRMILDDYEDYERIEEWLESRGMGTAPEHRLPPTPKGRYCFDLAMPDDHSAALFKLFFSDLDPICF